jgi:hypothetical protein
MARQDTSDLAEQLGRNAEALCRHYLSNGRRNGNYWQVGDVRNTPGRSLYVRLKDTKKGKAGKWTDAQSGEHGDLLDVIRESTGLSRFAAVADEARLFLSLLQAERPPPTRWHRWNRSPAETVAAARRLFAMSRPIAGTVAATYLKSRGLANLHGAEGLRFHPRCYYRPDDGGQSQQWPALIAAVTDLKGTITGVHRTWLARDGTAKAPVDPNRKAMGDLLGHGVRFDSVIDVMAAGEGIETVLSLRQVIPDMPMMAALSAAHLSAILFPSSLRRLYVIRDDDPAGGAARDCLIERANAIGIEAIVLSPVLKDFNEDLRQFGLDALRAALRSQLASDDVQRFMGIAV